MEIKFWLSAENRPAVIVSDPSGPTSRVFVFSDRKPFNWDEADVKAIMSDARIMDKSHWEETFPLAAANTSLIWDQYGAKRSTQPEKAPEQAPLEEEDGVTVCPLCGSLDGCSTHAVMLHSMGEIDDGPMDEAAYDFRAALNAVVKSLYERYGTDAIDRASTYVWNRCSAPWEMVWERYREWIGPEGSAEEKDENGEFDPNFREFTELLASYLWPYCKAQEPQLINSLGFSYYCHGLYAEDPGKAINSAMQDFQRDLRLLTNTV